MPFQQLADQRVPVAGPGDVAPSARSCSSRAAERDAASAPSARRGRRGSARTRPSAARRAAGRGKLEADAFGRAHRGEQRVGHLHGADPLALRFDVHRPRRVERRSALTSCAVERLLRRLRVAGQVAEQRSAMPRELLEVEHLRTFGGERGEQPALARTGEPADDLVAERAGQRRAASRRRGAGTRDSRRRAVRRASRSRSARA